MKRVAITGTGLYTPPESISNDELVVAFNAYVERHNTKHADAIAAGSVAALQPSSSEFIVKASGIQARHVVNKSGILDPEILRPQIAKRGNDEPSIMAEMGVAACKEALQRAGRKPEDVDALIVACSNLQRPYPAVAVEIQHYLGTSG